MGTATGECDCRFDWPEPDGKPSWHYSRMCHACRFVWGGLHCKHDNAQNPCPRCDEMPVPINVVTLTERLLAAEETVTWAQAQRVAPETVAHVDWMLRRAAVVIAAAVADGSQLLRASVLVDACELLAKELLPPAEQTPKATVHTGHSEAPGTVQAGAEAEHRADTLLDRLMDADDALAVAIRNGAPELPVTQVSDRRRVAVSLIDSAVVLGLDLFGAAVAVRVYETMVADLKAAFPDPQA